jgi:hypothetical protein
MFWGEALAPLGRNFEIVMRLGISLSRIENAFRDFLGQAKNNRLRKKFFFLKSTPHKHLKILQGFWGTVAANGTTSPLNSLTTP